MSAKPWNISYRPFMSQYPALGDDDKFRYRLEKIVNLENRTLIAFGMNPSVANVEQSDDTLRNLDDIAKENGYINWIMFNVFPLRDPNSEKLKGNRQSFIDKFGEEEMDLRCNENLKEIRKTLNDPKFSNSDIFVGWGNNDSKFLEECAEKVLSEIQNRKLLCLMHNSNGTPLHFGPRTFNVLRNFRREHSIPEFELHVFVYKKKGLY